MSVLLFWGNRGLGAPALGQGFSKYVESLAPLHWYRFDEASGQNVCQDFGSLPVPGLYAGVRAVSVPAQSPPFASGLSRRFGSLYSAMYAHGTMFPGLPGDITDGFTLCFFLCRANADASSGPIIRLGSGGTEGFSVTAATDGILFSPASDGRTPAGTASIPYSLLAPAAVTPASHTNFDLLAFRITRAGTVEAWLNGKVVSPGTSGNVPGVVTPRSQSSSSSTLSVFGVDPSSWLDDLLIFDRALSAAEMEAMASLASQGTAASVAYVPGMTGALPRESRNPSLANGRDITPLVREWIVNRSLTDMVDTAEVSIVRAKDDENILMPNTLVRIEINHGQGYRRYGDFLVKGPPASEEKTSKLASVPYMLEGVAKMLMSGVPYNEQLEPDRIKVNRPLVFTGYDVSGAMLFRLPRISGTTDYTDRWSPFPLKFLVTKFRNRRRRPYPPEGQSDTDTSTYSTSEMPTHIVLKNADNAAQILPGRGILRIDPDFYANAIGYGLGDPDPEGGITMVGERFCTPQDVLPRSSIDRLWTKNGRWYVRLNRPLTVYVDDGSPVPSGPYSELVKTGTWTEVSDPISNLGVRGDSTDPGATLTYTTEDLTNRLYAEVRVGPDQGIAIIRINGGYALPQLPTVAELKESDPDAYGHLTIADTATVLDLYSPAAQSGTLSLLARNLMPAVYTVSIEVSGQKNAASSAVTVGVAAFHTGKGDPRPRALQYGNTLMAQTGGARGSRFIIRSDAEFSSSPDAVPSARFTTHTQTGASWGQEPAYADVSEDFKATPAEAAAAAQLMTCAGPIQTDAESGTLIFRGLSPSALASLGDPRAPVKRLGFRYRRAARSSSPQVLPNTLNGYRWSRWGVNGYIREAKVTAEKAGADVGVNRAVNATLPDFAQPGTPLWNYSGILSHTPIVETATHLYTPGEWGLPEMQVADLSDIGFRLSVSATEYIFFSWTPFGNHAFVGGVEIIVETESGVYGTDELAIFDARGMPCNPMRHGLAVGDMVTVGNAQTVGQMLALAAKDAGMQAVTPEAPLYVDIRTPGDEEAVVEPVLLRLVEEATPAQLVARALRSTLPNYYIRPSSTGVIASSVVQGSSPKPIVNVVDSAVSTTDYQVRTAVLVEGDASLAPNLTRPGAFAVRVCKMDEWADHESSGGKSFPRTDAGYTQANAILRQCFDSSNETPYINGNGWTPATSRGVLWSVAGKGRWHLEDQPLFIVDLGRAGDRTPHYIDRIRIGHIDGYINGATATQSLQFFHLTEEAYRAVYGTLPPETPDQEDADRAVSYMPSPDIAQWRPITDAVTTPTGLKDVPSSEFQDLAELRTRFILVKSVQASWLDDTNLSKRRSRIGITEMSVYGTAKVRGVSVLGASAPFAGRPAKAVMDRLGFRLHLAEPNPYMTTKAQSTSLASAILREFSSDFSPRAVAYYGPPDEPGDTISWQWGGTPRVGLVTSVIYHGVSGMTRATVSDFVTPEPGGIVASS